MLQVLFFASHASSKFCGGWVGCLLVLGLAKVGKPWYMTSRLSGEFIDSCARELGAKRHRVELPWERKGLKEILNPNPFAELKIPAPDWVDLPSVSPTAACSSEPIELVGPVPFKHARAKLAEVTWAGSEDKKLHMALQ